MDMTYYKVLLDEVPKNLLSIPIIVHCIVAQVSIYECSNEDLEALKVARANKQLAKGLQNSFQKLGHGLSSMCKPFEVLCEKMKMERIEMQVLEKGAQEAPRARKLIAVEENKKVVADIHEAPLKTICEESSLLPNNLERKDSSLRIQNYDKLSTKSPIIIIEEKLSKLSDSTLQETRFLHTMSEVAAINNNESENSEFSENSSTKTQDGEEHLSIIHEFSRVERLEAKRQQQVLEFWDSLDAIKVEKSMLSLLAIPGLSFIFNF